MAVFKWTSKRGEVAILLSQGYTIGETAHKTEVAERTIYNWKNNPAFAEEVDRLSLMTDIAGRAERLRLAKRIMRKLGVETNKDLLEWLKYAQSETDGAKLNLASLFETAASVAGSGQDDPANEEEGDTHPG